MAAAPSAPRALVSVSSHGRAPSASAAAGTSLASRAYHYVRFPDPHANLALGEAPPSLKGSDAFKLPLHMRREIIPPVALSEAEKKAGLDIKGKRPNETQSEYLARRQRTPKHRDEWRWVLESDSGEGRYEGKELSEHSGTYLAIFPPDQPDGHYTAAKVDLFIDMKRHVDLSGVKARLSDLARVKKVSLARKRNEKAAVGTIEGKARREDKNGDGDDSGYDDPDLHVDHTYDLAIDRAGLDKDAMAADDYEPDDDDQGEAELAPNDEGVADVLPDGEVLDSSDEEVDEEAGGGEGSNPLSSSDDEGRPDSPSAVAAAAAAAAPPRPTLLGTVSFDAPAPKRARLDPLTEAVVHTIRTSGGRVKLQVLLKRLTMENPGMDFSRVKDVLARVSRRIENLVDGELYGLKEEYQ